MSGFWQDGVWHEAFWVDGFWESFGLNFAGVGPWGKKKPKKLSQNKYEDVIVTEVDEQDKGMLAASIMQEAINKARQRRNESILLLLL